MKKCKPGYYYCHQDKKCKKIPLGYRVALGGWLRKEKDDDEEKKKKNGNNKNGKSNGNGNGNGNGNAHGNDGVHDGGLSESNWRKELFYKNSDWRKDLNYLR
tara:strand:- start:177 stop:482 length:306 start_codon:yes stop_codon:yes gene_type:complete